MKSPKLICLCQQVGYTKLAKAVHMQRVRDINELIACTGIATGCGKCFGHASEVFANERAKVSQTSLLDDPQFNVT